MYSAIGRSTQNRMSGVGTLLLFWLAAAIAVPIWVAHDTSAWDLRIYGRALQSVQAHHDPYKDATDVQKRQNEKSTAADAAASTYSYVYSPLTLKPLALIGTLPRWLTIAAYWLLYVAGIFAAIFVGTSLATASEQRAMLYAAAVAPFLPGMLANGAVLSGNIAYILYGAAFGALLLGWRKGAWWCFYGVVLLAACVKEPLLVLALIPPLSARKQWLPALATMATSMAVFALQPLLWPTVFRNYLEAVELQFSLNKDFGASPAGLFSQTLVAHGIPYAPASYFFYLAYAVPIFAALVFLSRRYLRGEVDLKQWAPILLVGVMVLNPRIMEYDAAPITIPLALIAWRLAAATTHRTTVLFASGCALLLMNVASIASWQLRKELDGPLVMLLLTGGMLKLLRQSEASVASQPSPAWETSTSATSTHLPAVS